MKDTRPLLIVEDSDEDFEVTCWALRKAGLARPVIRAKRGEEALRYLRPPPRPPEGAGPPPCLALLDLNLPGMTGQQLLGELRRLERCPAIPVVIQSSSSNPRDIADCYRLGAAGYLRKPLGLDAYVEQMRGFVGYWFDAAALPEEE